MRRVQNKKGTNSYYKVKCHPKMAVLSRKVSRKGSGEYTKMPQGLGVLNTPRIVTLNEPVSFNADRRIAIWRRCVSWIKEELWSLIERLN